jgi:two-component system OmpR family sensor kinase
MSATADRARGGLRRSVSEAAAATPLRVKLITAVLVLVAVALGVISIAGLAFLRGYLIGQADQSVQQIAPSVVYSVQRYLYTGDYNAPPPVFVVGWLPENGNLNWLAEVPSRYVGLPNGEVRVIPKSPPQINADAGWLQGAQVVTVGSATGDARYRIEAVTHTFRTPGSQPLTATVLVGIDVTSDYQTLGQLTFIDVLLSGALLIGIGIIGVALIRTSLRPLNDIEETAGAIAEGDLSRRVPNQDPHTEIGRLGGSLNAMLTQIEAAFDARSASEAAARRSEDRMRQFVADASHELRTPLTAIRGFAEYYRQRGGVALPAAAAASAALEAGGGAERPPATRWEVAVPAGNGRGQLAPAELDRIMRRLEQESSRMGVLVEDMLLLARLDQQRPLEHRTVDLLSLAADAVHDARVVAPGRSIHLTVGGGQALLVLGDEVRLRQVIGNLMSNALAHTPDGSPIDVVVRSGRLDEARSPVVTGIRAEPGPQPWPGADEASGPAEAATPEAAGWARPGATAAVLEVTDHGPGMTREQAQHAFERFYRADQARTSGGTGLGLAIVAALVAAHGGTVWVDSEPGAGATFRIALPLSPEALHDDADDGDEQALAPEGEDGAGRGHGGDGVAGAEQAGVDQQGV